MDYLAIGTNVQSNPQTNIPEPKTLFLVCILTLILLINYNNKQTVNFK